jgi:hypothetical protein
VLLSGNNDEEYASARDYGQARRCGVMCEAHNGTEFAESSRFQEAMWLRETTARSGDIVARLGRKKAEPKSLGFDARHRTERFEAKNPESLTAQPSGFGGGQTRAPATDCV